MAEEKERVEAEEHIRALAKIWKPKPKEAEHGGARRAREPE